MIFKTSTNPDIANMQVAVIHLDKNQSSENRLARATVKIPDSIHRILGRRRNNRRARCRRTNEA